MRYRLPDDNSPKNRFSKTKLVGSKWTALPPQQAQSGVPYKHYIVVGWHERQHNRQSEALEIEAVMTREVYVINYKTLKNGNLWKMGWH